MRGRWLVSLELLEEGPDRPRAVRLIVILLILALALVFGLDIGYYLPR